MYGIGIDIGTTTICGVLIDEKNKVIDTITVNNDSGINSTQKWEKLQNPHQIFERCLEIYNQFIERTNQQAAVGVSGQMHGMLYVDKRGEALSPLYTWQDGRGDLQYADGMTYCQYLSNLTGHTVATGFGLVTHFYNIDKKLVPERAAAICSIGDYVAMKFAGIKRPVMHPSIAASFGFFDLRNGCFDEAALKKMNMDIALLPEVYGLERPLSSRSIQSNKGERVCRVAHALGDNQASFLGAVGAGDGVLLNIGTGSQISVWSATFDPSALVEQRPFINGTYLFVGAPLCGGYAFELLKNFYQSVSELVGERIADEALYDKIIESAKKSGSGAGLIVDSRFKGSRVCPKAKGSISGIDANNLMAGHLAYAIMEGICRELYDVYMSLPGHLHKINRITGSGNGIRKNIVMQEIIEGMFGAELKLSANKEEASFGAAVYALQYSV